MASSPLEAVLCDSSPLQQLTSICTSFVQGYASKPDHMWDFNFKCGELVVSRSLCVTG